MSRVYINCKKENEFSLNKTLSTEKKIILKYQYTSWKNLFSEMSASEFLMKLIYFLCPVMLSFHWKDIEIYEPDAYKLQQKYRYTCTLVSNNK